MGTIIIHHLTAKQHEFCWKTKENHERKEANTHTFSHMLALARVPPPQPPTTLNRCHEKLFAKFYWCYRRHRINFAGILKLSSTCVVCGCHMSLGTRPKISKEICCNHACNFCQHESKNLPLFLCKFVLLRYLWNHGK